MDLSYYSDPRGSASVWAFCESTGWWMSGGFPLLSHLRYSLPWCLPPGPKGFSSPVRNLTLANRLVGCGWLGQAVRRWSRNAGRPLDGRPMEGDPLSTLSRLFQQGTRDDRLAWRLKRVVAGSRSMLWQDK